MTSQNENSWDEFIRYEAFQAGLSDAEYEAFQLRFSSKNLSKYPKGCSEKKAFSKAFEFGEAPPQQEWWTYQKHRTTIFKKFSRRGWNYCKGGKSESLLEWLQERFKVSAFTNISLEDRLRNSLMTLNYSKQKEIFHDFQAQCEPAGLFLIQGKNGSCQKWLVNRLVHSYLPDIGSDYKISISLRDEAYIEDVWEQLGDQLLRRRDVTPSDLVEHIYQLWQKESIILAFYNLGELSESEPKKIISELWNPLIKRVQQDYKESGEGFDLLLFLVHNWGEIDKWGLEATSDLSTWNCFQPIELPLIDNFEVSDIQPWIRRNQDIEKLLPEPQKLRQVAKEIYQRGSNGDPERTMNAICKRCGANWYDIENSLAL